MDPMNYADLLVRLGYSLATVFVVIRFVYFPKERKPEYLFTFYIFNLMIFLVCAFLKHVLMDIGFAFGLFAVFSILRYRTESIPIREMTYQFLVITLGALHGLANAGTWHPELLFVDLLILALVTALDGGRRGRAGLSQSVRYEKIELILPGRRAELLADLRVRTGLEITHLNIRRIDFLNDSAEIDVHYRPGRST